jgi:hypothetical protein
MKDRAQQALRLLALAHVVESTADKNSATGKYLKT